MYDQRLLAVLVHVYMYMYVHVCSVRSVRVCRTCMHMYIHVHVCSVRVCRTCMQAAFVKSVAHNRDMILG